MNNKTALELFGLAVQRHREAKGMTQDALGQRCGRYKNQIVGIENATAHVTLDMVVVVAKALDLEPGALLIGISF